MFLRIAKGIPALMLVLGMVLTGCGSKRVTATGKVLSEPEPRRRPTISSVPPTAETIPPEALPDPKPLSRSGEARAVTPDSAPRDLGSRAVALARQQLGKPYQWGAAGPDKFDCSGLVQYVYSNLGVSLPRVSGQQASAGVHVDHKDLRPGDLVFFRLSGTRIDHVGIYLGRGRFVHAPRKHYPVRTDNLNDGWWRRKFKGGRRVG